MDRESKLKLYSLGIVLEAKERNSDVIKVMPIEELPQTNGMLSESSKKYDVSMPNSQGVKSKDKLESDSGIIAKWILGGGNRITAPDVQPSETVLIYRFADTDEYYWSLVFREPKLRKLETVNYSFSNLPSGMSEFDKDTSYWFEVSTHDKHVKLHTSKNDGEVYSYDIEINAADGNLIIKDDAGNNITLDSKNNQILLNTVAGASIDLNNGDINIKCNNLNIEAKSMSMSGAGAVTLSGSSVELQGGTITANGEDLITDIT